MYYVISKSRKIRFIWMTVMYLTFITAVDLYAYETKTELDINQYLFSHQKQETQEIRKIDYYGHIIFLKPIEIVKKNTEAFLLQKATITHEENDENMNYNMIFLRQRQKGPKIRLTF